MLGLAQQERADLLDSDQVCLYGLSMNTQSGNWNSSAGRTVMLEAHGKLSIPIDKLNRGWFAIVPDDDIVHASSEDGELILENFSNRAVAFKVYWDHICGRKWQTQEHHIVECTTVVRGDGDHGRDVCVGVVRSGPSKGSEARENACLVCGKTLRIANPDCAQPDHGA